MNQSPSRSRLIVERPATVPIFAAGTIAAMVGGRELRTVPFCRAVFLGALAIAEHWETTFAQGA
jgi:hypothetical protein